MLEMWKKSAARKMLENAAESHTSAARFVSPLLFYETVSFDFFPNLKKPIASIISQGNIGIIDINEITNPN